MRAVYLDGWRLRALLSLRRRPACSPGVMFSAAGGYLFDRGVRESVFLRVRRLGIAACVL